MVSNLEPLRNLYNQYCPKEDGEWKIMTRSEIWRMLKDCNAMSYGVSLGNKSNHLSKVQLDRAYASLYKNIPCLEHLFHVMLIHLNLESP